MRDQLIGYLLDALEPAEHEQVETQLSRDPQLRRDLEVMSRGLSPLVPSRAPCEPPPGLAERTCVCVAERAQSVTSPAVPSPVSVERQWSMADMVVAAGIFLAAAMLFFPAINQSRFAARVTQCQDNLRQVGIAMNDYSIAHNGFFPHVPLEGQCAAVGIIAVRLRDLGHLDGSHVVVCPASSLADKASDFRIPTLAEVQAARGTELARLHQRMAGSYGFNLGYAADGRYFPSKNLHRVRYAVVADTPSTQSPHHSSNHGGCGQNVLFEDQHVQYLTTCRAHGCRDDIYTNDEGHVRPGLHLHDAVLGPSHVKPRLGTVVLEIRGADSK
jgi:hypothetical protein